MNEAGAEISKSTTLEVRLARLDELADDLYSISNRLDILKRRLDGSPIEDQDKAEPKPAGPSGHMDKFSHLLDHVTENRNNIVDTISILEEYI